MKNAAETLTAQQETITEITTALIHNNTPFTFTPGRLYARIETTETTFTVTESGSFAQTTK